MNFVAQQTDELPSSDEMIFFRKIFSNRPFPVELNDAKNFELADRQEKLLELEAFS